MKSAIESDGNMKSMVEEPLLKAGVSIIVFTYNSADLISETLHSLFALPKPQCPVEIIVVDNNSSDTTVEIVKKLLELQEIPFKIILQEKPGLFFSRIAGIRAAKFGYFIFVDDDNRLRGDWVNFVFDHFNSNPETGLLGGVNNFQLESEEPEWWRELSSAYAVGRANPETGLVTNPFGTLWGAGLSGRTAVVRDLYNFSDFWLIGRTGNILLAGEDSELCFRVRLMGYSLFQSELQLTHYIVSRKINTSYLLGLHRGFHLSDHYLLQYRIAVVGSNWLIHNLNYIFIMTVKWVLYPFRLLFRRTEASRLDLRGKTPHFIALIHFWKNLGRWRIVHRSAADQNSKLKRAKSKSQNQ